MAQSKADELSIQIGQQRDRLTETVGTLADKVDVGALTEKIDTDALRGRAEAGAESLIENVTDADGKPKRGLLVGIVVTVIALVLARRLLK